MISMIEFSIYSHKKMFSKYRKIVEATSFVLLFLTIFFSLTLDSIKPFNYINICVFAFFCLFTVFYIVFYGKVIIDLFVILLLLFLLSQYIATAVNFFPSFTLTGTLICFMTIFIYEFLKQASDYKNKFIFLFALAGFLFLLSFFIKYYKDVFHPNLSSSNRIGSFFGNQNDVARHLSYVALSFASLFFIIKKIIWRVVFFFVFCISSYFIFLTGSISNTLVILFILFIYLFIFFKGKKKIVYLVCCSLIIGGFILLLQLPVLSYFKDRILNMLNTFFGNIDGAGVDGSFASRFRGAIYGFKLFFQNPIFGNGYASVYRNYYIMAHNNISEVAADFGLFGLIFEELIVLIPLVKVKAKNPEVFLLIIFTFIFQLFLVSFDSKIDSIIIPFCHLFVDYKKPIVYNKKSECIIISI